eukprot:GHRR01016429.1.p1 GENE.GHRR01016429.1~~GHRR01016429.1.p1  ORF type:complete len:370 (+),score=117.36 GHRR01016429.1:1124-2233(+)
MEDAPCSQPQDDGVPMAVSSVTAMLHRVVSAIPQVIRDVDAACKFVTQSDASVNTSTLAEALVALGYTVSIRESIGGGSGGQCLRNLHHRFLCCSQGGNTHTRSSVVIVDPAFREQFAITHPTQRYAAVLAALPSVFVGTAANIQPLVDLLCSEMSLAFQQTGSVIPPWRQTRSMVSKWLPRRSIDLPATVAAAGKAAAATAAGGMALPTQHNLANVIASAAAARSHFLAGSQAVSSSSSSGASSSSCCMGHAGPVARMNSSEVSSASSGAQVNNSTLNTQQHGAAAGTDSSAAESIASHTSSPGSQLVPITQSRLGDQQQLQGIIMQRLCGIGDSSSFAQAHLNRRQSFEPLQRVVGGFGPSTAQVAQ